VRQSAASLRLPIPPPPWAARPLAGPVQTGSKALSSEAGQARMAAETAHAGSIEPDYRAFVGRFATDYYLRQFARFDAGGTALSFNPWAMLLTLPWLAWRRLWTWAAIYFALPVAFAVWKFAGALPQGIPPVAFTLLLCAWAVGFPLCCNRLYWRRARAAIAEAELFARGLTDDERATELGLAGGTSRHALLLALLLQCGQAATVPLLSLHYAAEPTALTHAPHTPD
jgi:hypothetical protein